MNYSSEFKLILELRLGTPSMHIAYMGATAKMFNGFVCFLHIKGEKKDEKKNNARKIGTRLCLPEFDWYSKKHHASQVPLKGHNRPCNHVDFAKNKWMKNKKKSPKRRAICILNLIICPQRHLQFVYSFWFRFDSNNSRKIVYCVCCFCWSLFLRIIHNTYFYSTFPVLMYSCN